MLRLIVLPFRLYRIWVAAVVGYLFGSVLTADLVARAANAGRDDAVDLRATGSGNPGAANAASALGAKWGAAIMAGDMAKGALGAQAGRAIAGSSGAYAAATGAVIGHCYPAFANFRGGKGAATSAGTTMALFPVYTIPDIGIAAAGMVASRQANRAVAVALVVFVGSCFLWWRRQLPNLWGPKPTIGLPLYAIATSAVMLWKFFAAPELAASEADAGPVGDD